MVEIAYVCLSDLHIGAKNSLLTHERESGSVKAGLAKCLGTLACGDSSVGRKTTIVLAGDVVDLAMANVAAALYGLGELLLSFGSEEPGFQELVYVPGNHDHHLWTLDRHSKLAAEFKTYEETGQWRDFHSTYCSSQDFPVLEPVIAHFRGEPNKHLPIEQHIVAVGAQPDLQLPVRIAYPNYAIPEDDREGGKSKRVVFTHGHFVDQLYWMGSKLARFFRCGARAESPEAWDRQNGAWIDYVWSTMGSTGGAGEAAGLVWDAGHSPAAARELLRRLFCPWTMQRTAPETRPAKRKIPSAPAAPRGQERYKPGRVLGCGRKKMLWKYVKDYVPNDFRDKKTHLAKDLTLVFGHTHKPHFRLGTAKKTGIAEGLRVYNTGGWVVDGNKAQGNYGADLVVFDAQLNSAAVRLFRQVGVPPDVYTAGADGKELYDAPRDHASYDLVTHLKQVIATDPWVQLGETIQQEVARLIESHR
jgi:UDP-2,3-diacylglucosamine pyrophosphatase LpxH